MENIYKVETFIIFCMIIISILVYAFSFTEKPVSIYCKMNAKIKSDLACLRNTITGQYKYVPLCF